MSGKYSRTYSRKRAPSVPPISQFDRIVGEQGKGVHHPVAAKTAGHVGKWGMTSFTSLRCINENYGKEETGKRSHPKKSESQETCDNVNSSDAVVPKRRKFFKTRDTDSVSSAPSATTFAQSGPQQEKENTACLSLSQEKNSDAAAQNFSSTLSLEKPSSGGIKLKIFKSRNRELNSNDTYSSTVQLPSDDSGNSTSNSSSIASSPKSDACQISSNIEQCPSTASDFLSDAESLDKEPESEFQEDTKSPLLDTPSECIQNAKSLPKADDDIVSNIPKLSTRNKTNLANRVTEETKETTEPPGSFKESNLRKGRRKENVESRKDDISSKISLKHMDEKQCDRNIINEQPEEQSSQEERSGVSKASSFEDNNINSLIGGPLSPKSEIYQSSESACVNKKKSIFKSRQGTAKNRATYKHKWHGLEEKDESEKDEKSPKCSSQPNPQIDPFDFGAIPLTRVQTWPDSQSNMDCSLLEEQPVTSVKCPKKAKKYYTVIKNVKKTHQLQESGEFQEFNDDVEYFLDALRCTNSVSTRCLASLNLAQKCMTPAFRMHLRAHGTVIKFFNALSDAPSHSQLGECAAMVMFALSQDRLNMDLDRNSLELMLNLLDTESNILESQNSSFQDHQMKIRGLCEELQQKGHAKHLKLDKLNAATLAMETLLSLTSKRAGEWFKEELRDLGGVDHLMRTVTSCSSLFNDDVQVWSPSVLDKLSKIDRCLKVLENVTLQNEANQQYLLKANNGDFVSTLLRLFRMCRKEVPLHPENPANDPTICDYDIVAAKSIVATLTTIIKMFINLTHGSQKEALGSVVLGNEKDIYQISLYCLLIMPLHLKHETKFEIQVLVCCLLLNLVEYSRSNREILMSLKSPLSEAAEDDNEIFSKSKDKEAESAVSSLMTLFYTCEESAREQEAHTDHIIDTDLVQEPQSSAPKEEEKKDEDLEETVARLLQKAGRHMEDTLIAAYTALIVAFCLLDNKEFEEEIRLLQPEGHFKTMVAVLKKFLRFMNLTASTSLLRRMKPTERVVKYMEALDRTPEEAAEEERKKREKEEAAQAMAMEAFGF